MSLFVLVDATGAYWWLSKGGFSPIATGLQPMTFKESSQAEQKAAYLASRYGFDAKPQPINPLRRKRS